MSETFAPKTAAFDLTKPIASDGGSSSYYDREIPQWLFAKLKERHEAGFCYIKTEELIEVLFDNDFNFGTQFKSTVRAHGISVGGGKVGNNIDYEIGKIHYYADKIRDKIKRGQSAG